ncbi:MAG TPA: hypothetical protein DEA75_11460 [Rhodobacteraceae bacterium]|nr:hypothetical protein [Paracoccaceae bacterium]
MKNTWTLCAVHILGVLLSDAGLVFAAASLIETRHQPVRLALRFGVGQAHDAPLRSLARVDKFNTKATAKGPWIA